MKLNSPKAKHTVFLGTAVLTHHSAYNLIVSINMYSYVYHTIYYMDTNNACLRNMNVTNIKISESQDL